MLFAGRNHHHNGARRHQENQREWWILEDASQQFSSFAWRCFIQEATPHFLHKSEKRTLFAEGRIANFRSA